MTGWKGEKGAVLPLVGLSMVVIVLLVGLAVDMGHVHNVKIELQRAVDAAALAGVHRLLPNNGTDAINAATAIARTNTVDGTLIGTLLDDYDPDAPHPTGMPTLAITPGQWDTEHLEWTVAERFKTVPPDAPPYNAVQVYAEKTVGTFFFYPFDPTVAADAIAVKQPEVLTIPLAVISCIPPTGKKKGEFNVCGIETYNFAGNAKDGVRNVAGWTTLTIGDSGGVNTPNLKKFLGEEGKALFNQVTHDLETVNNQPPEFIAPDLYDNTYQGCEGNQDEKIVCGLGGEFDLSTYESPTTSTLDPLERYAQSGTDGLPRFITLDETEIDAFNDILSQDGSLQVRDGETWDDLQARLKELYEGNGTPDIDYNSTTVNPERFQPDINGNERLIQKIKQDNHDIDNDGVTSETLYIPRLNKVLNYAGYPPVWATTGEITAMMHLLLEEVTDPSGKGKDQEFLPLGSRYAPFDGTNYDPDDPTGMNQGVGKTLKFTLPVIHAGTCVGFDPKSFVNTSAQEDGELYYVGLANFLVTRILEGGTCYYHVDPVGPLNITTTGCTDNSLGLTPDGDAPNDRSFKCPEQINPGGAIHIEGLIRPPGLGGEDVEETGVFDRVFLVE